MIIFECPACTKALRVKPDLTGKKVKCPKCAQAVVVPAPSPAGIASTEEDVATLAPKETGPVGVMEACTVPPSGPRSLGTETRSDVAPKSDAAKVPEGRVLDDDGPLPSIPGFEVLSTLGRGGMGVVYKAKQARLNRLVALKMILSGPYASAGERSRFLGEAQAVARLQHPNIVQIHEIGEHDGNPYFSLEYCDGGSLAGMLNGTPLPALDAAHIVHVLAQAMQKAHDENIIHRDLKPGNILLARRAEMRKRPGTARFADLVPKITDFGLAKKLDEVGQTASGAVMGTPSYMAPEQAGGESKTHGPAADIYALGAILYECLTGRPPFKAASSVETIMMVVSAEPVPPSQLNAKTPRDLETICLKCLQKEPRKRYASAADLADDLDRFEKGEPIAARPIGSLECSWRWCRRNPKWAGVWSLVVFLAVTGSAAVIYQLNRAVAAEGEATDKAGKLEIALGDLAGKKKVVEQALDEVTLAQTKTAAANEKLAAEKIETARQRDKAEKAVADLTMTLARNHWTQGHARIANDLLADVEPRFRLGGWHFLKRQFEGSLFTLYTGAVNAVCFSPDGQRLAMVGPALVKLLDARSGQDLLTLKGTAGTGTIASISFSADGQRVAAAVAPSSVKVWDARTGEVLLSYGRHKDSVNSVCFSPDGQWLASAGRDRTLHLWDSRTGQQRWTIPAHAGPVRSLSFSPDGQRLATASEDRTAKVWDARTGKQILDLGPMAVPTSICFSPDGQHLATAHTDNLVKIWDAAGQPRLTLKGHTHAVESICFSPDGQRLASASHDHTVKLWSVSDGQEFVGQVANLPVERQVGNLPHELLTLHGHTEPVRSISFSADGQRLASTGDYRSIKMWDVRGRPDLLALTGNERGALSVAFSPDGQRLAARGFDGSLRVWDALSGRQLTSRRVGGLMVCFSPDGQRLASTGPNKTAKVWDAESGEELVTLTGHADFVQWVCFRPDGKQLATAAGDKDKTVKIWDADSGQELLTLAGHKSGVQCVCFSPDGKRLASTSFDNTAKVWDAQNGKELMTLSGHVDAVWHVCFSKDGQRIATASRDKTVKIWDANSGLELRTLSGHADLPGCVAFSPDGQLLASAGRDWTLRVWDAHGGQELVNIRHGEPVMSVCFSPDGQRLASASLDKTVRIWDVRGREEGVVLTGHRFDIRNAYFSADGATIFARDIRHGVLAWDATSGTILPGAKEPAKLPFRGGLSPDGKTLALPMANRIHLIAVGPPAVEELAYRETATRVRADWHEEQALRHAQHKAWFAAAFHHGWAATGEPDGARHWQQLDLACRQQDSWRHAVDALIRVLQAQPLIDVKLPQQAFGLELSVAIAYQRLGNQAKAREWFDRVQLPGSAGPGLRQLRENAAALLGR